MSPQKMRTYGWLFAAMSASVCANVLMMQPRQEPGGAGTNPTKAMRVGATAEPRSADQVTDTVRAIQRELIELKLYPGQIDGKPSLLLSAAVMAYEQAQALPITGEASQGLLRDLIIGPTSTGGASSVGVSIGTAAERVVRDVRQKLIGLGYAPGSAEGRLTLELIQAIRAFERDAGLPQTGRISATLMLHLQRRTVAFKPR